MAFKANHVYNYLQIYIFDTNIMLYNVIFDSKSMLGVDLHGCVYRVKLVAPGMFR